MSNVPYVVGQWVRGPAFYGRERQIAEVLDGPRSSLWLVGTRRVGKTSLLKQLEYLTTSAAEPVYFPVFWDFQGAENAHELHLNFSDALLDAEERLERLDLGAAEIESDNLFASLGRLRRLLRARSLKLLLLCDEVEELVALARREPAVARKLRRAMQASEDVRTVLASTVRLWELSSQNSDTSPFLHGFSPPVYVGRLSEGGARELIRQTHLPASARPAMDDEAVETIRRRCDDQPYLLQLLGKRFAEGGDLERAIEQVATDRMVSHFFTVDFDMLADLEREALRFIGERESAGLADVGSILAAGESAVADALHRLERLGFVRSDAGQRYVLANHFFRRWLRDLAPPGGGGAAAPRPSSGDTTAPAVAPGALIDERYELLEPVGEGATGLVFRAHDRLTESEIAIKLIRPEYGASGEVMRRFRQEIVLSRDIGHPNVLRIYHLGEHRGERYLTMQWVDGPTLADLIAEEAPFGTGRVAAIGAKIASALEAAHARRVLHRDVKPQNILMHQRVEPLVTDFGLAREIGEAGITATGMFLGTPDYVSPEQANLGPAEEASDLYSLGVVLFEMTTGRRPFSGDNAAAVLELHRAAPPPDPRSIRPEVDAELAAIVLRCLEKDPRKRFTRAADLRAALAKLAGDRPSTEELLDLVYQELRRMARGFLSRERPGHTLQPTALVHEAYLRMADQSRVVWRGRTHFLAIGARAMRRILIDHARARGRQKRGGGEPQLTLNEAVTPFPGRDLDLEDLLTLDAAMERLRAISDRQATIVELRFFGGLTVEEVAEHLGVSIRTVESDWARARGWLKKELGR
jgi:RNA polymerase sigma factor (TIGR02999 family)